MALARYLSGIWQYIDGSYALSASSLICELTRDLDCTRMHPLELTHLKFVRRRTRIRHDKLVLGWISKCWRTAAPHHDHHLSRDEYQLFYRKLLTAMTVGWDDNTFDEVAGVMWHRDAGDHTFLDFERFCCSVFSFVEMWVNAIDREEYIRILSLIWHIAIGSTVGPIASTTNPTLLQQLLSELQQQQTLEQRNLSFGRSVLFDPVAFESAFGSSAIVLADTMEVEAKRKSRASRVTSAQMLKRHQEAFRVMNRPHSSTLSARRNHFHEATTIVSSPIRSTSTQRIF